MARRTCRWVPGVVVLLLVGCGQPVGQPAGKVTWKTQPAAGADLTFQSEKDATLQFFGRSGDDGRYQVSYRTYKGVPVGRYKVTVAWQFLPGGKPLPGGEAGNLLRNSGKAIKKGFVFEADVAAGASTLDLELSQAKQTIDLAEE